MNHPINLFDDLVTMWADDEHQDTGRHPSTLRAARDLCRIQEAVSHIDSFLMEDLVSHLVDARADDYVSHSDISNALSTVRQAIDKVASQMLLASWYQSAVQHAPRPEARP